jgi:hypothetical protein
MSYGFDDVARRDEVIVSAGGTTLASTAYAYHADTGRLDHVSQGQHSAHYSYATSTDRIHSISLKRGQLIAFEAVRGYDNLDQLESIFTKKGAANIAGRSYVMDDLGRRTRATDANGNHTGHDFNDRGELTGFARTDAAGQAFAGTQMGYAYDNIGNRVASTVRSVADPEQVLATSYTPNEKGQKGSGNKS